MQFFPFSSFFSRNQEILLSTGDVFTEEKQIIKQNPSLKMMVTNLGDKIVLIPLQNDMIRDFFNKQELYTKSPEILIPLQNMVGDGLFAIEGDVWRKHRRVISQVFNFEALKLMIPSIVDTVRDLFDEMELRSLKRVKIMEEFQMITGEVVSRMFFGKSLTNYKLDGKPVTLFLASLMAENAMLTRSNWGFVTGPNLMTLRPAVRALYKKMNRLRKICNEVVNARKELRKKAKGTDCNEITGQKNLLDLLLEHQENNGTDSFTDKEIVDEYVSFFFAGMDTTGHLVTLVVYLLHQHPEILSKVKEEVQKYYRGKPSGEITYENINSMELLQLSVKETLRHHTPVPRIFRVSLKDHKLGSVNVKKGTLVAINMGMNNYNPNNFENPEKFDPYRWLDKKVMSKLDPFAFTPFSSGAHNCIGQHLSQLEARIIISEFMSRYDFKISEGYVHGMTQRLLYEPQMSLEMDLEKISK